MGKIYAFVLGMAAGCGLYHLALSYHVVHASDGLHLTPKVSATLVDTYVDIRSFTPADVANHPELALAITQSGNEKLQRELLGGAIQGGLNQALELLGQPQE